MRIIVFDANSEAKRARYVVTIDLKISRFVNEEFVLT